MPQAPLQAAHILVELEFGERVHIDRQLGRALFDKAVFTQAIHRCRRCVNELRVDGLAPVQQGFAVFEVVTHHELAIPLGGG